MERTEGDGGIRELYPWLKDSTDPLSREEERAAFARLRAGDCEARDLIVRANLRFVAQVALYFCQLSKVEIEQIFSFGLDGLQAAIDRFRPERGCKFISYAVWRIKLEIINGLQQQGPCRLPFKVAYDRRRIRREMGRTGEDWRTAGTRLKATGKINGQPDASGVEDVCFSLDSSTEGRSYAECLADEEAPDPQAGVEQEEEITAMWGGIGRLDPRLQYILAAYFGLDDKQPTTLSAIGKELHLTRERVRQLKEEAVDRLRKDLHVHETA